MARGPSDPTLDLNRILKQKDRPTQSKARWRIMVASDPSRPIRTFTLPRLLPTMLSLVALSLIAATVILAFGSWKLSGSLGALQHRVRAMVQAADSVALAPGGTNARDGSGDLLLTASAAQVVKTSGARFGSFTLQSVNTSEEIEVKLNLDTGEVDAAGYARLRHIMRCQRTTAETPIDPRLIDLLYRIAQRTHQKLMLVSGFRAPMFSLATLSFHTRGMAADIRIPGMTPLMARDLAESMGVHGLGYYPVSGFIHVDVRDDNARWTDYGQNRQDGEGTEHGPSHGEDVQRGDVAAGAGAGAKL
jgi:uncharacterized protein YcbK (DUF882 family)